MGDAEKSILDASTVCERNATTPPPPPPRPRRSKTASLSAGCAVRYLDSTTLLTNVCTDVSSSSTTARMK